MQLEIPNELFLELENIAVAEGLDNINDHVAPALGLLVDIWKSKHEFDIRAREFGSNPAEEKYLMSVLKEGTVDNELLTELIRSYEKHHHKNILGKDGKVENKENYIMFIRHLFAKTEKLAKSQSCRYLHSADLMLPNANGIINFWLIACLLDIEYLREGKAMLWQQKISSIFFNQQVQLEWTEKDIQNYTQFLQSMEKSGLNPDLSQVVLTNWPGGTPTSRLMILGGSHRMAYLLSKNENFFAPVKIFPLPVAQELREDYDYNVYNGFSKSEESLMFSGWSIEDIEEIMSRYKKLYNGFRRYVSGLIDMKIFIKERDFIMDSVSKISGGGGGVCQNCQTPIAA